MSQKGIECAEDFEDIVNPSEDKPKEFAEKLATLRAAISDVPGLHGLLDDEFVGRFLRTKKYVVEDALELYLLYWTTKRLSDDLSKIKFSEIMPFYNDKLIVVLPDRHNGSQILYVRISLWEPTIMTIEEYIMSAFFLMEEVTSSVTTQIHGVIVIVDGKDLSFSKIKNILKQLNIKKIRTLVSMFQGGYPAKFKGVHITNAQYFWSLLLGMINPFLKEKLRKRIHMHGKDLATLHKIISPSILPKSLGGKLEEFEDTALINSLIQKQNYYNELSNFGFQKEND